MTRLLASLALALTLTACSGGSGDSSPPTSTSAQPARDKGHAPMSDVGLWSLCSAHAKGKVSGSWSFPYSGKVAVKKAGSSFMVTGPVHGPGDQTFQLSCTYADVTADGARLTAYGIV